MKNKLTTILLSVLATVSIISLTSSNPFSASYPQVTGAKYVCINEVNGVNPAGALILDTHTAVIYHISSHKENGKHLIHAKTHAAGISDLPKE